MSDTITLGRSPVQTSPVGVGTMSWGVKTRMTAYGGTRSRPDEQSAFQASFGAGVTLFDTAEMYGRGNSERRVGELARGTAAIIATKYAPSLAPPFFFIPRSPRHLPKALEGSLARLGRTTIDLYQIHYPVSGVSIPDLMGRLADAVDAGKVRAVGVSNYSEAQMREAHAVLEARGIPLASNQVQFSLLYRRPEFDGVLRAARELDVTLLAYMPLAMGALSGKYRPGHLPTDWMRRRMAKTFRPREVGSLAAVLERLSSIGRTHGRSIAQVALRWVMEHGAVPIPGAKDGAQALENSGARTFSLTSAEIGELRDVAGAWVQDPKWKMSPSVI